MPSALMVGIRAAYIAQIISTLRALCLFYFDSPDVGDHALDIILIAAISMAQLELRPMTVSDLSGFTGTPRATTTRRISSLARAGIIKKVRDGKRLQLCNNKIESEDLIAAIERELHRLKTIVAKMDP